VLRRHHTLYLYQYWITHNGDVTTQACILHCVVAFPLPGMTVQAQTVQVPGPAVAQQQATVTAVAAPVPQMIPAPTPERAIMPVVSMAPAPTALPIQTALPIPTSIQQCTPLAPTVASPNMIMTSAMPQIQSVSPQQQPPQVQPQLQTQVSTADEELACCLCIYDLFFSGG
jgi:hypothetical protein